MQALWRAFALAWTFFTVLPSPVLKRPPAPEELARSAYWLPVVGGVVGGAAWLADRIGLWLGGPLLASFFAVVLPGLLTGFLHVDGFMDVADALGSRTRGDAALAVMKDSRVGAMGAIAAILLLVGKWIAAYGLGGSNWLVLWLAPVWSRAALLWAIVVMPAARPSGLGALFARRICVRGVALVTLCSMTVTLVVCRWLPGLACMGAQAVIATYSIRFAKRRFGGATGDVYGALVESGEWCIGLLALAMHHHGVVFARFDAM
ncbi:cobalamin-5'-phosphate synthase [Alicyclobacillus sacchari]|uniref:Adenosylcobinamide-GDP ribazoletransferase n=1 Tax=Alicyclobacillus sacchari TaxID=392010 RepID=A0A4R8LQ43_9BACL|nr:adenosylcobinamide-GDP ribazoletransferase [Alicyclobacillus sacchari]TDY47960.1 cobalamin-5'-phosphate synthase [Alicyclobacillus sacchari]GMA56078.1 adenosylcobinamide-GDP ribazoletransferase [Alicyclobacillus sacchari]